VVFACKEKQELTPPMRYQPQQLMIF